MDDFDLVSRHRIRSGLCSRMVADDEGMLANLRSQPLSEMVEENEKKERKKLPRATNMEDDLSIRQSNFFKNDSQYGSWLH